MNNNKKKKSKFVTLWNKFPAQITPHIQNRMLQMVIEFSNFPYFFISFLKNEHNSEDTIYQHCPDEGLMFKE